MIFAFLVVGCSGEPSKNVNGEQSPQAGKESAKKTSDLGDFNIQLGGEVKEQDDIFVIEGKSNLLPGARVVGELWVDEKKPFADTTELVQEDGSFHMQLDHHKYGEAKIVVRFDFEGVQDDAIKRHYGNEGQKLEGPFIYKHKTWDGIFKKAEASVEYLPNEENDLTIKPPKWLERPEDYGDPRVWIEIDEITEDGEFYYLKGHSNLLEGSELRASYGWNNDKTMVKPDGSFDFKIDYEYRENTDFVVEFVPSNFQWNEIEEAYGMNGQKLVGDLVVANKYNTDQQFIEKHIPWDGSDKAKEQITEEIESLDKESNDQSTSAESENSEEGSKQ